MKGKGGELVQKTIVPEVSLGAHTASLGIAVDEKNILPGKYKEGVPLLASTAPGTG
jgi:glucose/arabinose dehydrogenase